MALSKSVGYSIFPNPYCLGRYGLDVLLTKFSADKARHEAAEGADLFGMRESIIDVCLRDIKITMTHIGDL